MKHKNRDFIIISKDGRACIFCDGKVYGDHIKKFVYENNEGTVNIEYDADMLPVEECGDLYTLTAAIDEVLKEYEPLTHRNANGSTI